MNTSSTPGGGAVSQDTLDISVRVYPFRNPEESGKLLAFADVTLGGCFAVKGIRVMDGARGPFVSMPSWKDGAGEYREICFPTTAQMRERLNAAVMGEFQRVRDQPQRESGQNDPDHPASPPKKETKKAARDRKTRTR